MSEIIALELGFDGGVVLRVSVPAPEASKLEQAFSCGKLGTVTLPLETGPLIVDLSRVVYLRHELSRSDTGFAGNG